MVGSPNDTSWYHVPMSVRIAAVPDDGPATPNLTDALVELSFAVQARLARVAGEHEMSLTQVRLLGILRDREPGIVELAEFLSLDKSSVSGLVDRAERRGLVERASSRGTDGRAIRVVMTERGREAARAFAERVSAELGELVGDLSPAERQRLTAQARYIVRSSGPAASRKPRPAPSGSLDPAP